MRQVFRNVIWNQIDVINFSSEDSEENRTVFHICINSSPATTFEHPSSKHQNWFDENDAEIPRLLEKKKH